MERSITKTRWRLGQFRSGVSARPIRLGASTIEKVNFDIKLDIDKLLKLREDRKFDILISNLKKTLTPFDDYKDIPSNLTHTDLS